MTGEDHVSADLLWFNFSTFSSDVDVYITGVVTGAKEHT